MSKTKKILIIEDDRFLANSYELAFESDHFQLTMLYDGESVLETALSFSPDLILLDIILPKKDGFTVLKELKSDPITKHIPVVIASNLGQQEEVAKGKSLGAVDYIIKSDTSIIEVVKIIKSHLEK